MSNKEIEIGYVSAEKRIQDIIGWEEINGPSDTAGALFCLPFVTGGIALCSLALQTPEVAGLTGLFCFAPSLVLSLWVLRFHIEHYRETDNLIENARNCAVPDLPKPYNYKRRSKTSGPIVLYESLLKEIYRFDEE